MKTLGLTYAEAGVYGMYVPGELAVACEEDSSGSHDKKEAAKDFRHGIGA